MNTLLAGSTGLIGHELVALWPQNRPGKGTLHLLLRKASSAGATTLPPHQQVHVVDFNALPRLPAADEAVCCLGTTIAVAGSQAAFRAVDHGAVLAFAKAAQQAGATRFAVVSSLGADAKSASFYSRVKGEMELELRALKFKRLVIARPSLLAGKRSALQQAPRWGERLALAVSTPLAPLIPLAWRPIEARTVARALWLSLAQPKAGVHVLESKDLQTLGRQKEI